LEKNVGPIEKVFKGQTSGFFVQMKTQS